MLRCSPAVIADLLIEHIDCPVARMRLARYGGICQRAISKITMDSRYADNGKHDKQKDLCMTQP